MIRVPLSSLLIASAAVFVVLGAEPLAAVCQDPKPAPAPTPRPLDLRSLANGAVHSLRAAQARDGSYGGNVRSTGLALFGFARMVRQYREVDGPFISRGVEYLLQNGSADGSFAAAADKDPIASTCAAALALDSLDAKKYADLVKGAVAFVSAKTGKAAPVKASIGAIEVFAGEASAGLLPEPPLDETLARDLLTTGRDDKGGYGDVSLTASRLILINRMASRANTPKPQESPATALPAYDPNQKVDVNEILRRGIKFLVSRQGPSGEFGGQMSKDQWLGVTALSTQALWSWPGEIPADVKAAATMATAKIAGAARPDGSIHGGGLENYTTSASLGALVASKDPSHKAVIDAARRYITELQADEGEGISKEHWTYGGFGYGNEERPDMSNTQVALDALIAAGATSNDPALKKALTFLARCQNRGESNNLEISRDGVMAVAGNDGGAVYFPGKSQAGSDKSIDGTKETPRSYGSMTYALLKGFVFAGVDKSDPRMKAAFDWCKANYTLDRVPGYEELSKVSPRQAYQGLFYYYLTMATALRAAGDAVLDLPSGKKVDWRQDMAARLASMQKADGSWINENSARWYEGDEVIATAYAVLTLAALTK